MDLSEIGDAGRRAGRTPENWLQWIVQFINKNIDTLTKQEKLALEWESGGILKPLGLIASAGDPYSFLWWVRGGKTPCDLPHLQAFFRTAIEALVDQGQVNIALPAATLNIQTLADISDDQKETYHAQCPLNIRVKKEGMSVWGFHLGFLLNGFGHRLRRCRVCSKIFFASRQDQFVCGRKCINVRGQRVWRDNLKKAKSNKAKTPRKNTTRKGGK